MAQHCPKTEAIIRLEERCKLLESQVAELKKAVLDNAHARIYHDGVDEGRRTTDKGLMRYIMIAVVFLGSTFLILIMTLFAYIALGTEQFLALIRNITEFLGG